MSENSNLTPKQRKAIPALLTADTIQKAADITGVSERTLHRWLKEGSFTAELHQAQDRAIDEAVSRLSGEARAAASTLATIHRDVKVSPAIRVQAAQALLAHVLKLRDQRDLADRIVTLEELINEQRKQAKPA